MGRFSRGVFGSGSSGMGCLMDCTCYGRGDQKKNESKDDLLRLSLNEAERTHCRHEFRTGYIDISL